MFLVVSTMRRTRGRHADIPFDLFRSIRMTFSTGVVARQATLRRQQR